jgi:hypothetical protein
MLSAGDVMTVTGRPSIRFGGVVDPIDRAHWSSENAGATVHLDPRLKATLQPTHDNARHDNAEQRSPAWLLNVPAPKHDSACA